MSSSTGKLGVEHIFTDADQAIFAQLSGDYNPLHMDPVYSRRLMFGKTVVHGVHALLWAIDVWLERKQVPVYICALRVDFTAPIGVNEPIHANVIKESNDEVKLHVLTSAAKALQIHVKFTTAPLGRLNEGSPVNPGYPDKRACNEIAVNDIPACSGSIKLHLDSTMARRLFPSAERYLPAIQIAELIATSLIVGMVCPGMNSLYSGFALTFSQVIGTSEEMAFKASEVDERFSSFTINVTGPTASGKLRVFYRPPVKKQLSYLEVLQYVKDREFAGQRALVIGGSRGLGEVTAKLLAAGGADVLITFHCGSEDAHKVQDDILSGGGKAGCIQFDVLTPPADLSELSGEDQLPTHLYYFATPFIFEGVKGVFSVSLFNRFVKYYAEGFVNSLQLLRESGCTALKVFYPSTVAIEEIPSDMGEYSAAKAAGESICQFLNKSGGLEIICPRLPRLDTDQTANLFHVNNLDPVPYMRDILRQIQNNNINGKTI